MTTIKKLLIAGLCLVGSQVRADDYKTIALFSQELGKTNSSEDQKVAQWLQNLGKDGFYVAGNEGVYLSGNELATVVITIESNLTKDAKVARLSQIMLEKKLELKKQTIKREKAIHRSQVKGLKESLKHAQKSIVRQVSNARFETVMATVYAGFVAYVGYQLVLEQIAHHDAKLTNTIISRLSETVQPAQLNAPSLFSWISSKFTQ